MLTVNQIAAVGVISYIVFMGIITKVVINAIEKSSTIQKEKNYFFFIDA